MNQPSVDWPEDYFSSANLFLQQAQRAGSHTESHKIVARGPEGEDLSVDVAAFIARDDEHRVILVSGVHGVEGFLGAAVQLQLMRRLAKVALPANTGMVLIHAVNPWGYAHLRRVDENNVDVNRNFQGDKSSSKLSHPLYATLNPIINAKDAPSLSGEINHWLAAGKQIVTAGGIKPLFAPIAQGQYDYPHGLFYGGDTLSESCAHLQTLIEQYTDDTQRVSVLDVHSGLGPAAFATLIGHCNYPVFSDSSTNASLQWLETQLEQRIIDDSDDGNSYNASGTFARWCSSALSHKQLVFLCIEVGTVNPLKVFSALRRENQAHFWSSPDSHAFSDTKQVLREVFSPSSERWRNRSIERALGIVNKVIGLPVILK